MSKEAVIFGYSGHAYVVLEILMSIDYHLVGYSDNELKENDPFKLQYLGSDSTVFEKLEGYSAFLGIGNNYTRAKLFKKLVNNKINCPSAVHEKSFVSQFADIGNGTTVMAGVVINALAQIGNAVICNSSCVIEHECKIGNYAHIGPGAVLAGNVTVGENSFVGANAVIKQGVTIGSNVIIGAGSVVVKDVANGLTIYGNPARETKI
jgi:sugar O-acyltransferase (sialic acid O-acetyltransferase NeuD family)